VRPTPTSGLSCHNHKNEFVTLSQVFQTLSFLTARSKGAYFFSNTALLREKVTRRKQENHFLLPPHAYFVILLTRKRSPRVPLQHSTIIEVIRLFYFQKFRVETFKSLFLIVFRGPCINHLVKCRTYCRVE